jgi:hypothetical protein
MRNCGYDNYNEEPIFTIALFLCCSRPGLGVQRRRAVSTGDKFTATYLWYVHGRRIHVRCGFRPCRGKLLLRVAHSRFWVPDGRRRDDG